MSVRSLTRDDVREAAGFVLMAAFPPGSELPSDALEQPHARRWLQNWGEEFGVGWEENGALRGAAWARHVEPVLVRDKRTGEPLREIIISVVPEARGAGVGRTLMEALLELARSASLPGLSLTVSERNPVALRLYESVGFIPNGTTTTGLVTMVWLASTH